MNNHKAKYLFLLPGNPSIPGIYQHFLSQLDLAGIQVHELHHLGQKEDGLLKDTQTDINLTRNFHSHREQILQLHNGTANNAIFICHSLGASSYLYNIEAFVPLTSKLIFICPFIKPEGANKNFLQLFNRPWLAPKTKAIIKGLLKNQKSADLILSKVLGKSFQKEHINNFLKQDHYLEAILELVSDYIRFYGENQLYKKLDQLKFESLQCLFAQKDFWSRTNQRPLYSQAHSDAILDINHDFCSFSKDSELVAKKVNSFISSL